MNKLRNSVFVVTFLFLLNTAVCFGVEDGFGPAQRIKGGYFDIYYKQETRISDLVQQLNITPSDRVLAGEGAVSATGLAGMLDTLFLRVSDILDMHLYSLRSNIKISPDYSHLRGVYRNLFNRDLDQMHSFYVHELNTVYILEENFRREILGHEIAHVIISHYFVVQPPVKVAEVLSGYVEYQLRKTSR